MRYSIRPALAADAGAMLALLPNLADFEVPANRNPDHLWQGDRELLQNWLDGNTEHSFVLVAAGEADTVLGISVVTMREELLSHEPSAHLEVLVVSPQAHRQGIGQALIAESGQQAKNRGAQSMSLHVFSNNTRARSLYEKAGFNGELMRYYKEL